MKPANIFMLFCMLGLVLTACDSDDEGPNAMSSSSEVNMRSLKIGQSSRFVAFYAECGFTELDTVTYFGDTLVWTVTGDEEAMIMEEKYTTGSVSYYPDQQARYYPISSDTDRVVIPNRADSRLFFFYGSDYIYTRPDHDIQLVQEGCTQMADGIPFVGDAIGFLEDFKMGDIHLEDQTVVSCVPVIIDLEAYLLYADGSLNQTYWIEGGFPGVIVTGFKRI